MITIYGASDDLVEVDGCEGADEFNVYGSGKLMWRADFLSPQTEDEPPPQLRVYAIYDGCWHFSVGQVDEVMPLPSWPLRIRQGQRPAESEYSAVLEIDAPEGTRIDNLWPAPDADL